MSEIRSYQDLQAWQEAMNLVVQTYSLCKDWPRDELYGLTSQARRAAVSIPANIAEGYGRDNRGSYVQHLRIAQGSLKELETHLLVAVRVGVSEAPTIEPLLAQSEKVGKILRGLIRSLE